MRRWAGLMLASAMPAIAQAQVATPLATPSQAPTPAATTTDGTPAAATAQTPPAPQRTQAQPQPEADEEGADEGDVVVTARREPGKVPGDIPPEQQLSPADIRAYGVSSVSDLLTELAPQTTSGRGGSPVILLNGRRIAGFQEIRDLPTEAILRVDILPEEVSLKYGYRADQKVVNFVLRPRFRSLAAEAIGKVPTQGGSAMGQGKLDWLQIRRDKRLSIHTDYSETSRLTEAERGIIAPGSNASLGGNIVTADPGLAALTGTSPSVVGVPGGLAAAPSLAQLAGSPATSTDVTPYRTLQSAQRQWDANVVYARNIFDKVSASFNAEVQTTQSNSWNGLPTANLQLPVGNPYSPFATGATVSRLTNAYGPLVQDNTGLTAHLGTVFNGDIGKWRWSLTGSYDRAESRVATDTGLNTADLQARLNANDPTANPYGPLDALGLAARNFARSTSSSGEVDALLNGRVFALPAGDVQASVKLGGETSDFSSSSTRFGVVQTGDVSRDIVNGQVNLDFPIANRDRQVLGAIGDLSLNVNAGADHLSDFGTLTTVGYGANWSPLEGVRFLASWTDQEDAPTAQQLGNPTITTPNVRLFDYVRGTTATITAVTGGNPALVADNRHVMKLGLNVKPWRQRDINLTANYYRINTDDPIASFPTPTAAIEEAFPDRFTRDAGGNLLRVDSRPINFARTERSQLRWGLNFSKPIKSKIQKEIEAFRAGTGPNPFAGLNFPGRRGGPGGEGGPRGDGSGDGRPGGPGGAPGGPGAGGPGGGFRGGGFGGGRGGGGGRVQFALYHTWTFADRVIVADGGPDLDLLRGDAIGSSGGTSRHQLEAQAGYANNGVGMRLSGNWRSATRVNGGTPGNPQPLEFGSLATLDFRLFADLGQRLELLKKHPWLRGTRVSLVVDNVFNQRQRVTDATGTVPIGYQPGYLDPLGRTVRLSIRKLFF
ncbi:TonB-dependent receptor [Sphingomonas sanguinis]|uniref:TonB-dependent receptor n=1 Tax=Sphingomonas sanguinis TaxID=33051 RepID=A0A7Y7QWL5_9SPHN|nr:TonB-dependent receptor [Sphingomonas sanguinis]MBZ6382750.1 TonB-dependent receptor [Sphingomonas sanguinis]NNG48507.1 TonB-dependent receptor [Sphingomonas sanguinis]NNG51761.1 TonB-dependent receptor [Sphingomonas sanguinis]NVP32050.1 TonB-dependent receptor [Sphingomonas sanguinis]